MTIKAQRGAQPDQVWWPAQVRRRVREVVPSGVEVVVREDPFRGTLDVTLSESRGRRAARRLGLARVSRRSAIVRATIELADAPAGLRVQVRWI